MKGQWLGPQDKAQELTSTYTMDKAKTLPMQQNLEIPRKIKMSHFGWSEY